MLWRRSCWQKRRRRPRRPQRWAHRCPVRCSEAGKRRRSGFKPRQGCISIAAGAAAHHAAEAVRRSLLFAHTSLQRLLIRPSFCRKKCERCMNSFPPEDVSHSLSMHFDVCRGCERLLQNTEPAKREDEAKEPVRSLYLVLSCECESDVALYSRLSIKLWRKRSGRSRSPRNAWRYGACSALCMIRMGSCSCLRCGASDGYLAHAADAHRPAQRQRG